MRWAQFLESMSTLSTGNYLQTGEAAEASLPRHAPEYSFPCVADQACLPDTGPAWHIRPGVAYQARQRRGGKHVCGLSFAVKAAAALFRQRCALLTVSAAGAGGASGGAGVIVGGAGVISGVAAPSGIGLETGPVCGAASGAAAGAGGGV